MRTIFTLLLTAILGLGHTELRAQGTEAASRLSTNGSPAALSIRTGDGKVFLEWSVSSNSDTEIFEVETSRDGRSYGLAAVVFASEKVGREDYKFYERMKKTPASYRVKIIQKDGSVRYSEVVTTATNNDRSHL